MRNALGQPATTRETISQFILENLLIKNLTVTTILLIKKRGDHQQIILQNLMENLSINQ
jgi:hypothetical protein